MQKSEPTFTITREPVIEPTPIDDIYCTVAVAIEPVGPCHRLSFATPQPIYGHNDERALMAVAKLMVSEEVLRALLEAIPQYLDQPMMKRSGAAPAHLGALQ